MEPRKKGSPLPVSSSYSQWEPWRKLSIILYKINTVVILCLVFSEQINSIVFLCNTPKLVIINFIFFQILRTFEKMSVQYGHERARVFERISFIFLFKQLELLFIDLFYTCVHINWATIWIQVGCVMS